MAQHSSRVITMVTLEHLIHAIIHLPLTSDSVVELEKIVGVDDNGLVNYFLNLPRKNNFHLTPSIENHDYEFDLANMNSTEINKIRATISNELLARKIDGNRLTQKENPFFYSALKKIVSANYLNELVNDEKQLSLGERQALGLNNTVLKNIAHIDHKIHSRVKNASIYMLQYYVIFRLKSELVTQKNISILQKIVFTPQHALREFLETPPIANHFGLSKAVTSRFSPDALALIGDYAIALWVKHVINQSPRQEKAQALHAIVEAGNKDESSAKYLALKQLLNKNYKKLQLPDGQFFTDKSLRCLDLIYDYAKNTLLKEKPKQKPAKRSSGFENSQKALSKNQFIQAVKAIDQDEFKESQLRCGGKIDAHHYRDYTYPLSNLAGGGVYKSHQSKNGRTTIIENSTRTLRQQLTMHAKGILATLIENNPAKTDSFVSYDKPYEITQVKFAVSRQLQQKWKARYEADIDNNKFSLKEYIQFKKLKLTKKVFKEAGFQDVRIGRKLPRKNKFNPTTVLGA